MHFVKDAEYKGGYELVLTFGDGARRRVDLREHLEGEVFEPLKDTEYFKRFHVSEDLDTIVWPNGADFSPDFLYEIGQELPQTAKAV